MTLPATCRERLRPAPDPTAKEAQMRPPRIPLPKVMCRVLAAIVAMALLAVAVAACGGDGDTSPTPTPTEAAGSTGTPEPTPSPAAPTATPSTRRTRRDCDCNVGCGDTGADPGRAGGHSRGGGNRHTNSGTRADRRRD